MKIRKGDVLNVPDLRERPKKVLPPVFWPLFLQKKAAPWALFCVWFTES